MSHVCHGPHGGQTGLLFGRRSRGVLFSEGGTRTRTGCYRESFLFSTTCQRQAVRGGRKCSVTRGVYTKLDGIRAHGLRGPRIPFGSENPHEVAHPLSHVGAYHVVQQNHEFFRREKGSYCSVHHVLPHGEAERGAVQSRYGQGSPGLIEPSGHFSLGVPQLGLRRHGAESWYRNFNPTPYPATTWKETTPFSLFPFLHLQSGSSAWNSVPRCR